jgi:hypothetical protein
VVQAAVAFRTDEHFSAPEIGQFADIGALEVVNQLIRTKVTGMAIRTGFIKIFDTDFFSSEPTPAVIRSPFSSS